MKSLLKAMIDAIFNNLQISPSSLKEILIFDGTLYGAIQEAVVWFGSIALVLSIIYFIVEMDRLVLLHGANVDMKALYAPMFKFGASMMILLNGRVVMKFILDFWNACINFGLSNNALNGNSLSNGWGNAANMFSDAIDGGFFFLLFMFLPLILFWIVSVIVSIIWNYKAIVFKFKFVFRVLFAPVALADIYQTNNSQTIRYIKGSLALAIAVAGFLLLPRIGAIVASTYLTNMLTEMESGGSGMWDVLASFANCILVPIAELGAIGAIEQFAKEALQ